jgi:hypothetical protein
MDVGLNRIRASEHRLDQVVDESFSVSPISSHLEGMSLGVESSSGASKLEGPQEVVGFLEVLTAAGDLVDEVLNGVDVVLSEGLLDEVVGLKGNSLSVDLAVSSLENEFSDGVLGGVSVGDVGLNSSEHIDGGSVELDEDTIVELSESEESHDSDSLGVEFVNTSDSNNEGDFGLGRYVDLSGELSLN